MNVWFGLFCLFISVISVSHTSKSSSELELYLSSVNRGADICDEYELESCDLGRGMWGFNGLCGAGGTAGTGASRILTVSVRGGVDWHLFSELSVINVVLEGYLSPIIDPVTDCVEGGLGG